MMTTLLANQLMGLCDSHLDTVADGVRLHREVIPPFQALRASAREAGIDLVIASGYRDFARQLAIWNGKVAGLRPLLSADGERVLDALALPANELLHAILRWSALPGASRHHWGTDMDVWDRAAVPGDYRLQLTLEEYGDGGPFARLNHWMASGALEAAGFFCPYDRDLGGVSPEPWHISYRPLAERYSRAFDCQALRDCLADADIALKDEILHNLDAIVARYVCV